jgi:cysteine-rich repeat protein
MAASSRPSRLVLLVATAILAAGVPPAAAALFTVNAPQAFSLPGGIAGTIEPVASAADACDILPCPRDILAFRVRLAVGSASIQEVRAAVVGQETISGIAYRSVQGDGVAPDGVGIVGIADVGRWMFIASDLLGGQRTQVLLLGFPEGDLPGPSAAASFEVVNGSGFLVPGPQNVPIGESHCGNGLVDSAAGAFPETCDDGNNLDGDCCSATCQYDGAGAPCASDADGCSAGQCNGVGTCNPAPSCTDRPIAAIRLILRRTPSGVQKLSFASKDPSFLFPPLGAPDDPRTVGARLDLVSGSEGIVSLPLPAGSGSTGWSGRDGTVDVYTFKNKTAPNAFSTIKVARLKDAKLVKIVGRATGLKMETPAGSVGVRLKVGNLRSCTLFDATSIRRDLPQLFLARTTSAGSLADCTDGSLGAP